MFKKSILFVVPFFLVACNTETIRTAPPEKTGLAKQLEDFTADVIRQRENRDFAAEQARLRKQQARRRSASSPPRNRTSVSNRTNKNVILFEHCNYMGKSVSISPGNWDMNSLIRKGVVNDDVSSIYIPSNYEVDLYKDAGFSGRKLTLRRNTSCLVKQNFNDVLSSLKVRTKRSQASRPATSRPTTSRPKTATRTSRNNVILYEDCNYSGKSVSVSLGNWGMNSLIRKGMVNDKVSSIYIPSKYEVDLYKDAGFSGRKINLRGSTSCLVNQNFNDVLSSLKVRTKRPLTTSRPKTATRAPKQNVVLYEHCNYKGKSVSVSLGNWNMNSLISKGMVNDDVSSIFIPRSYAVDLYKDAGFSGRKLALRGSTSCLVKQNFNDVLSSLRVRMR